MILRQRYLARYLGPKGDVPLFAIGCPGSGSGPAAFQASVPRALARFLGLKGGVPLYGYSTCEFPHIGRYLMRFVGMTADGVPVYALGCCLESSSGSSGESSGLSGSSVSSGPGSATGPLSGTSCPESPWETQAFGGASWSGGGWSIRISFQDSANCGGTNANTQAGTASRRVCLSTPQRLTVHMTGNVERQNFGYEYAQTRVNGALVASGSSIGEGLGCAMITVTAGGSIDLPAGDHLIELYSSTIDPLYHVGAYWQFDFTWEPL